jgi:hypothetical protein
MVKRSAGLTQSPCPDPDLVSDWLCRQVEFLATPARYEGDDTLWSYHE